LKNFSLRLNNTQLLAFEGIGNEKGLAFLPRFENINGFKIGNDYSNDLWYASEKKIRLSQYSANSVKKESIPFDFAFGDGCSNMYKFY